MSTSTPTSSSSPRPKKSSVFDKLTDTSLYTGTHKQRFDEEGKGKGIHGRKEIATNNGYVEGFKANSPKKTTTKEAQVVDRLTNPKLFTGTHKQRFDESGKGKGIDGRVDRVDADGYVDGFKKAKESGRIEKVCDSAYFRLMYYQASQPAIFDRLTDPKLYTGSHKQRFDEEGKGKGKEGRNDDNSIHDLSDITRPNLRLTPNASSSSTNSPRSARSGATTPQSKSRPTSSTPKKEGPSIFDKLTDPKQYTGSHKHRFDQEGKGRGKEGRTDSASADGYVHGYKDKDTYEKK